MLPLEISSMKDLETGEGRVPDPSASDEHIERLQWLHSIYRDGLTGLPNSRYCEKRLFEDSRKPEPTIQLLLVEIGNYQSLLHSCPKGAVEQIVLWVASFLTSNHRPNDICCRISDQRFVLLIPGGHARDAFELSHRLVAQLVKENLRTNRMVELRFSKARFDEGIILPTLLTAVASPNRKFSSCATRQAAGTA